MANVLKAASANKRTGNTQRRQSNWRVQVLEDRIAPALLDPLTQPRFVNPLPVPAILQPTTPGGTHYEVPIVQVQQDLGLLHPISGLPLLTTVWGYNGVYPGPTIEAQRDQAITVRWNNQLSAGGSPLPHLLSEELMLPLPSTGVPLVTHTHGGRTQSSSDGLPQAWSTPNFAETGPDFRKQTFRYDNSQSAAGLWYHDHAEGITRLNVYAGLAGTYLIREPFEDALNLPDGSFEIPLVIQDRSFTDDGELTYPPMTMTSGSVGNFIMVNGKAWPSLEVEPRKYRFRLLNGSDSRFYNLSLAVSGGGTAPVFNQLGTDLGFLAQTQTATTLLMAPAERFDVVIDFSNPALAGKTIILNNAAPAPYPGGSSPNPATVGQLMAFRVTVPLSAPDVSQIPTTLRPLPTFGPPIVTRQLLLSQGMGQALLGTVADGRMFYADPVTETPQVHETEVWEFYNNSPSSHPVHLHLAQFLILNRQTFTATTNMMTGALTNIQMVGAPIAPLPENNGPKDTAIVQPGQVLRVVTRFDRGGEYVWHCHMLAHEDNEMMRPILVLAPPVVDNVIINNGAAQRSVVTGVEVRFDSLVTLPTNPADAFQLKRATDNATVTLAATVTNTTFTSVQLMFTGGAVNGFSLADGRFNLTISAGSVSNANGMLDGNGDGYGGDPYLLNSSGSSGVFRLFGDSDGDGTVAANDFIQFRLALGGTSIIFDFDNDGAVATSDFIQFRLRFGGSI